MSEFIHFLALVRPGVEAALERRLPDAGSSPRTLHAAMRYAALAPGKRVRPALVALGHRVAGGGVPDEVAELGAALEMVHAFSLVHDDLPALDDDDLRRGRPTVHRQFDEATAVLAGDALLSLATTIAASTPVDLPPAARLRNVERLAGAVSEMIGGQALDLAAEREGPAGDPQEALQAIHRGKTAALLRVALELGAGSAGASDSELARLSRFGDLVGVLFQVQDDILDVTGSPQALGKTPGKDAAANKLTYPAVFGLDRSRSMARQMAAEAEQIAASFGAHAALLCSMIEFFLARDR